MHEVLQELDSIELKIKALADHVTQLKKDKEALREENRILKKDLDQVSGERHALAELLKEVQTRVSAVEGRDSREAKVKKELGQYIKEIDKCILLLQEVS